MKNPFKIYQDNKRSYRLKLITEELAKLKKEKVIFKALTHLAKRLADMLYYREQLDFYSGTILKKPSKFSHITLLRNKRYRLMLTSYQSGLSSNPGTSEICIADISKLIKTNPALEGYLGQKDLEISNLKKIVERYQQQELKLIPLSKCALQKTSEDNNADLNDLKNAKNDLDKLATSIHRMTEKLSDIIVIDYDRKSIIDRSDNVEIVDSRLLKPFFDRREVLGRYVFHDRSTG
jgi:oligoribonuclease (3'-5' exoribonuclease)